MKRLILCSDGSWDLPTLSRPGNVARLAAAIEPAAISGCRQLVFYQNNPLWPGNASWPLSTAEANQLDHDILALYRFICDNHEPGDELWFFGYSRGTYIVRSCIALLRNLWLLPRTHTALIPEAYRIYRTRWGADATNADNFRRQHCRPARVRFLGLWDSVGERGLPAGLLAKEQESRYGFRDNRLSGIVEHACHALAIDEQRRAFAPCLWKTAPERSRTEQCWFTGSHTDMGGGHGEDGLGITSLLWMADRAQSAGLAVNTSHLSQWREGGESSPVHQSRRNGETRQARVLGQTNHDETLHTSAEQRFLTDSRYRPANLGNYLSRDEQIQLPI